MGGFEAAALTKEQECELAPEIEMEREVERPPRLKAHPHDVHTDLESLIHTGTVVYGSKAFVPALVSLDITSAGKLFHLRSLPDDLLVTGDFMHTVQIPPGSTRASFISDSYQRQVQFILSVPSFSSPGSIGKLIIISPYEVNQLLPLIRQSDKVTLHIYAPRFNVSHPSIDDLTLYNVGRAFSPGSV